MKSNVEPLIWAVGIATCFAGAAQVMGVPVIENTKNLISCIDGYGLHCR